MRYGLFLLVLAGCAETFEPGAPPAAPHRETSADATARVIAEDEARKVRELEADARAAAAAHEAHERDRAERQAKFDAEEVERANAAAARAREDAAKHEALMRDVETYAVPAISAIMCSIENDIRDLRAKLARENRVEAIGGVRDLRVRNEIANDIVDDTEELKGWAASLKKRGAGRMACKAVEGVEACRHVPEYACADTVRGPARAWGEGLDALWVAGGMPPVRR